MRQSLKIQPWKSHLRPFSDAATLASADAISAHALMDASKIRNVCHFKYNEISLPSLRM